MGIGANSCNHRHTSHMMQLMPGRHLKNRERGAAIGQEV